MFCKNCGKELPNEAKFCDNCGAQQEISEIQQQDTQSAYYPPVENPAQPELPMKWYKFTIYFSLFAGSVINVISAIMSFTGADYMIYNLDPEMVYSFYDGLQILDIFHAVILIGFAVFCLYVRQNLAKFKKNGPMQYYILGAASTAVSVIYTIGSTIIIGDDLSTIIGSVIGMIMGNVVALYCEIKYFTRRKHLFVN